MINKATLIGNLGADPELRVTASGADVANFRIACTERYRDRNGNTQESTEWHTIICWNKLATEVVARFLQKGTLVYVEGRIETRKWTTQSGEERSAMEINCRELKILARGKGHQDSGPSSPARDPKPEQGMGEDVPF